MSETGAAHGVDLVKAFPLGSDLEVIVLEADAARRRIRLSVKAIGDAVEAKEVSDYAARSWAAQAQSFGSLADKLRGALEPRKKQGGTTPGASGPTAPTKALEGTLATAQPLRCNTAPSPARPERGGRDRGPPTCSGADRG